MRRISTLFQTIKDLNKDRWVRKYNPHQQFFVDVDWYDTEEEYLNALRDDWKSEADPFDECDYYVDVSKYDNFEDYEKSVNICLNGLKKYLNMAILILIHKTIRMKILIWML